MRKIQINKRESVILICHVRHCFLDALLENTKNKVRRGYQRIVGADFNPVCFYNIYNCFSSHYFYSPSSSPSPFSSHPHCRPTLVEVCCDAERRSKRRREFHVCIFQCKFSLTRCGNKMQAVKIVQRFGNKDEKKNPVM